MPAPYTDLLNEAIDDVAATLTAVSGLRVVTDPSTKLGIIGDPYVPADGINVAALLSGGFIVEQSTPKPKKPAKTSTDTNEEI